MKKTDIDSIAKLYMENSDVSEFETEAPHRNNNDDFDSGEVDDADFGVIRDKLIQITFDLKDSGILDDALYSHFKAILDVLDTHIQSSYNQSDDPDFDDSSWDDFVIR